MRILIFTNHFFPENFKVNDVAFELAKAGFEVTVITGIPNYPSGKIYKNYGFFKRSRETLHGVRIVRLPLVPRGSGSSFRLSLNYLSFLISASVYALYLSLKKRYDIVFVHQTSPATIGIPGAIYKLCRKVPMYFWVLDLWPESVKAAGGVKNVHLLGLLELCVKFIYRTSTKILISSQGFKDSIIKKGDFISKIIYFPNWAEDVFFEHPFAKPSELGEKEIVFPTGFRIIYAGNLGEAQDFDNILKAAKRLEAESVNWIFVGSGRKEKEIKEFVKVNGLGTSVYLPGNFPVKAIPYVLSKADALLLSLKDEEIFKLTVPAKLQVYLAAGKPIIGILKGEGAQIISDSGAGFICSPGEPDTLCDIVRTLLNMSLEKRTMIGENGADFYRRKFDKHKNIDILIGLIKSEFGGKDN